ncbi:DEAD/DEAH box helicase family protein [Eubacterium sp.]|uniref:DEAD/DEAH box helicase family protein n=1 Tax=Eubacterium sp. TaxID=142586 RepID=UPI0025E52F3D|nr:DEAD/DEAH box helicase family protein [Eubacterium sp.]MCR5628138.1 DEAD/DEAH box helicase family protein [Eubacterium sp.]
MIVFNEDTRVKIPATIQFMRIGYDYQSLNDDDLVIEFNTKIFVERFKKSIERINNISLSDNELKKIIIEIHNMLKNNDLGKEFYYWLINPVDRIKLIDFDNIENNDFAVVDELPFTVIEGSEEGSFRPDINILINGMPLGFLEVKKPDNEGGIQVEFDRMVNKRLVNTDYKKFFNMLQIVTFSNNMEYEDDDDCEDVKAGSFYSTPNGQKTGFSFFREDEKYYHDNYPYIDIDDEKIKEVTKDLGYAKSEVDKEEFQDDLKTTTPCNSFITSLFDKERLLYLLKYGIMYIKGTVTEKHIMRYPQFFATRRIIDRLEAGGKGGIIWHTQGSGKTALAAFSNRVVRDYYAKKGINARFFFVVDRIDLLRQASSEFANRGLNVVNCDNKEEFTKELNKTLSTNIASDSIGEICVVNIQKFEGKMPEAKNDYNAKIQRVFFVDEAHRSYRTTGEFFKNLMICDLDAVYIALTGTPLLSKKERSNLKFGDYIHKYFYDKSIADGYTLKIKKENIDTIAKTEIKQNLEFENLTVEDKIVYESPAYISALGHFIEKDFKNFRYINADNTIGGMIVCRTNNQARSMHEWFEENSEINTGLVITDVNDPKQAMINKNNQIDFRDTNQPDILIVNFMLTTGYDVKRLKKMYLLRGPHAQALLQTISRVNRPYKSPTGKLYKYGYIVDFVDIEDDFNSTLESYIKELEADLNDNGEDEGSLANLVIDKEDINRKYKKYLKELEDMGINTSNLNMFQKMLDMFNKPTLLKIRRLLRGIKECHTEFILSRAMDYAEQIDVEHIKQLLRLTQLRIDFVNLKDSSVQTMDSISDSDVVEILYEFIKTKILILDLGAYVETNPEIKEFSDTVTLVQKEIKSNKNKDDIRIIRLNEILEKIFNDLSISDLSDISNMTEELKKALEEAKRINEENDRLAKMYGNSYAFVKTYQDSLLNYNDASDKDIETTLQIVYECIQDKLDKDIILVQGRKNFIDEIKKKATKKLLAEKVYSRLKAYYDALLGDLYTNIQLFK